MQTRGKQTRFDMSRYTFIQLKKASIQFSEDHIDRLTNPFLTRIMINFLSWIIDRAETESFYTDFGEYVKSFGSIKYEEHSKFNFTKPFKQKIELFDERKKTTISGCKREFITFILERFAVLPIWEQERLYFYEEYKTIEKANDEQHILFITYKDRWNHSISLEVHGHIILMDHDSLAYYLIGYTKERGTTNELPYRTLRLSRISDVTPAPKEKEKEHHFSLLSTDDSSKFQAKLEVYGPAYMVEDVSEPIRVSLTEHG